MSKYKFSKDILDLSAGNFKEFVKGRYPEISDKDLRGLIEENYGKDEVLKDTEVQAEEVKSEKSGNSSSGKRKTKAASK